MLLSIPKWSEFQHYEHRRPPWIKLHRQLLDNRHWYSISGDASKLLAECWLIASGTLEGTIEDDPEDLAFRLHRDVSSVRSCLQELERHHFIELDDEYASTLLALAVPEKRRVEKSRERVEKRERTIKKEKRSLPSDWQPNEKHQQIATTENVNLSDEAEQFRDGAVAHGRTYADWDRAFNTWLRNAKNFKRPTQIRVDEEQRDADRRADYRARESSKNLEQWESDELAAEAKDAEMREFYDNLPESDQKAIESDVKKRARIIQPNGKLTHMALKGSFTQVVSERMEA